MNIKAGIVFHNEVCNIPKIKLYILRYSIQLKINIYIIIISKEIIMYSIKKEL